MQPNPPTLEKPRQPLAARVSAWDDDEDAAPRTVLGKIRTPALLVLLLAGGFLSWRALSAKTDEPAPRPATEYVIVKIAPPVKKIELPPPVVKKTDEVKPESPVDVPKPPPQSPPATATPSGKKDPGALDLRQKGRDGDPFGEAAKKASAAAVWTAYAQSAHGRIVEGMLGNAKTRNAKFEKLDVRVWPDVTGRITRAALVNSTGDEALDKAIRDDVLVGLMLPAPPDGMPTPMNLRVQARRPN